MSDVSSRSCVLGAWHANEPELRAWLRRRAGDDGLGDDILADVFLKVLRLGDRFCAVEEARAWLFQVARTTHIDRLRTRRELVALPESLAAPIEEPRPVDTMVSCLPRALRELSLVDAEVLQRCDIEGMTQATYAREVGISLPGAKSRLQRARRRLKEHISTACRVRVDDSGEVCCFVHRTDEDPG